MQQVDARGNEWQGALDAINGLTLTDPRTFTNTLNSNASVTLDIHGKSTLFVDVRVSVTFNAATSIVIEGSVDGTNFFAIPFFFAQSNDQTNFPAETTRAELTGANVTAGDTFLLCCSVTGFKTVRARMAFTTAGTAAISMRATQADYRIIAQPQPTLLWVTATAAAGTAITLTIPAPGAGLFHYITYLNVRRATNVAEAAAAPLTITTTNLPGSPIWTVGTAVPLGGQVVDVDLQLSNPLKSSVANTATTIVAPDPGTNAIWRLNAGYYIGA